MTIYFKSWLLDSVEKCVVRKLFICLGLSWMGFYPATAQWTEMVKDTFTGVRPIHYDLSTKLLWGNQAQPHSAFLGDTLVSDATGLGFHAKGITPLSRSNAQYSLATGLKTNIALDYPFPFPVDRNLDSIRISADFLWETLLGVGESGRFVMALMHSYPAGGPAFGDVDSVNAHHPFGRPTYNVRIMNKNSALNNNLNGVMMYGGGNTRLGDFEIFRQGINKWWLPGFITEPGGTSPGSTGVYPTGGCAQIRNNIIASTTKWRHFTWNIYPERMTLSVRNTSEPETAGQIVMEMYIPKVDTLNPQPCISAINTFYNINMTQLPELYNWFPKVEAFRFFWNAGSNVWLANLTIETTGNTSPLQSKKYEVMVQNRIVPNPGNGFFQLKGMSSGSYVEVYNALGNLIEKQFNATNEQEFDGRLWTPGLYFLRIKSPNLPVEIHRWIKE